ncbi:MAG: hypothetical protein HY314_09580 [Acidobacteria bacterium]|nr:hypothetical protein [Acidobacteriota bacterium]
MRQMITCKMFLWIMSGLSFVLSLNATAFAYQEQEKADRPGVKDATIGSTAFTYQGQLKDANGPVTGTFDFQFNLYSAQSGGEQLGLSEMKDVTLTNGLFSFKLDFGRLPAQAGAAVEANESWLEIGVRPSGSGESYTVLFPRQKLTPTPYAIFAQHEQWSLIGVPVGFTDRAVIQEGADAVIDPVGTTKSKGDQLPKPEATPAAAPLGTPGTIAKFDTPTTLVDSVITERNGNVRIDGNRSLSVGLNLDTGNLLVYGNGTVFGAVGIGTDKPNHRLSIAGPGSPVWTSNGWYGAVELDNASAIAWKANAAGQRFGLGHTGGGLYMFRTTSDPGTAGSAAVYDFVINDAGNIGIGTATPQAKLDVVGRTITNVLQITGGNFDFSEEFAVTAALDSDSTVRLEQVRPGMVVRIDEQNPGQLIVSTQAYDRRVAGIISGAGNIQPGLLMTQSSSLAEGSHPVALTGRVYCWADASTGQIEPGDFLTTSNTPGHAMKVKNHKKAQGTIIGKAMTGLERGTGLVLVLVMPQ